MSNAISVRCPKCGAVKMKAKTVWPNTGMPLPKMETDNSIIHGDKWVEAEPRNMVEFSTVQGFLYHCKACGHYFGMKDGVK